MEEGLQMKNMSLKKREDRINLKSIIKRILCTIIPSIGLPGITVISFDSEETRSLVRIMMIIVFLWAFLSMTIDEERKKKQLTEDLKNYEKFVTSNKILNSVIDAQNYKANYLKNDSLTNDVGRDILLYNAHAYIEHICNKLKNLIASLTEISLSEMSVSFICRYPSDVKSKWKWITRKMEP